MNVVAVMLDDAEVSAIDSRSMPFLESDPFGSWVRFPNAVTSTPLCHPDRLTMHRGQRSDHHGHISNFQLDVLLDWTVNVGTWLAAEGWATAFFGKYANGWPFVHLDEEFADFDPQGWDRLFADGGGDYTGWLAYQQDGSTVADPGGQYLVDRLATEAAAWVATVTEPFILRLDPNAPHGPYTPPARHAALDAGGATSADDPPGWNAQIANAPAAMVQAALTSQERAAVRVERADARRALRGIDEALEVVLEAIDARGMMDDTAVFVLNDNGTPFGRHRLDGGTKQRPYRWCTDLMLRVRWPGQPNRVDPRLVSSADLPVTWAAMGGATPSVPVDGIDIRPLLDDTADGSWRSTIEFVSEEVGSPPPWRGLLYRTVGGSVFWRYVERHATAEVELYDQNTDPAEVVNVAGSPANADIVAFLSSRLARRRRLSDGMAASA